MDWRVGKFCSIHIGKVSQGDGFLQNQGCGGSGPDSNSDVSVTYCWITAPNLVTKNSFAHDFTCHFSNSTPTMWTGITLSWQMGQSKVFKTASLTFLSPWGDNWALRVWPQCWAWLLQHAASGNLDFLHGGLGSQRVFQETGTGGCLGLESSSASPPSTSVEPTQIREDPISQWEKWLKAFMAIFDHQQWIELVPFLQVNLGDLRLACSNETGDIGDDTRRPGDNIKETSNLISRVCLLDVSGPPVMLLDLQMLMLIYWRSS